jgi:hypothetical protein
VHVGLGQVGVVGKGGGLWWIFRELEGNLRRRMEEEERGRRKHGVRERGRRRRSMLWNWA